MPKETIFLNTDQVKMGENKVFIYLLAIRLRCLIRFYKNIKKNCFIKPDEAPPMNRQYKSKGLVFNHFYILDLVYSILFNPGKGNLEKEHFLLRPTDSLIKHPFFPTSYSNNRVILTFIWKGIAH